MAPFALLLRQRGYFALAVATLVVAIGANLVVFTVVNVLWIRPLPIHDPGSVVMIMGDTAATGSAENVWFAEVGLRQQVREVPAFSQVAGQVMTSETNSALRPNIVFDGVGHPVETLGVTSEYFSVLALSVRGRDFTRDDDRYGATPVAIISDRLWRTEFHADPTVIGRTVSATPRSLQIIGVAPPDFRGARRGEQADLWIPRNLVPSVCSVPLRPDGSPSLREGTVSMLAIARLRPGVSIDRAQKLLDEYNAAKRELFHLVAVPLSSLFGAPDHRTLVVNEGAVVRVIVVTSVLVLIGGCATLMALVLVHYERRRQELAIRLALGASRSRLVRQLTGELAWIMLCGFSGALILAWAGVRALPAFDLPGGVNLGRLDLTLDIRVLMAACLASSASIVVAACAPLIRFTRASVARALVSPTGTSSAESLRSRQIMLSIHVAATLVVLIVASLFVRTIQYGFGRGTGFDIKHTLFVSVDVATPFDLAAVSPKQWTSFAEMQQAEQVVAQMRRSRSQQLLSKLQHLSSVTLFAEGPAPIGVDQTADLAQPRSIFADQKLHQLHVARAAVGANYFDAIGIPLTAGRSLSAADLRGWGHPAPVVVTTSLATTLWPGSVPLGKHFRFGSEPGVDYEVVGVVSDFAYGSLRFDSPAVVFLATDSRLYGGNTLRIVLKTTNPDASVDKVQNAITETFARSPRILIATGRDIVATDLGREQLGAWFFSGFGIVAVGLGLVGVFGLVGYFAESRRREFGVRIALGASQANLTWLALRSGLLPAMGGVLMGIVVAWWAARGATSLLVGVTTSDLISYAGASSLMMAAAIAAGLAAAWKVRRISPIEALKAE